MTKEETLMLPRYKVIADWPGVAGEVIAGQILTLDDEFVDDLYWVGGEPFTEDKLKDYPHLFKKLEWWEERSPEEMPKFVKCIMGNCIGRFYKVAAPSQNGRVWHNDNEIEHWHLTSYAKFYIPITEEEYNNQNTPATTN